MSEVQIEDIDRILVEDRMLLDLSKTKEALYALLMEKMPKKKERATSYSEDVEGDAYINGHIDGYNDYADEMVSAINELFGRTE